MSKTSPIKREVSSVLMHFEDYTSGDEDENFAQVTEWINGEGIDVAFGDRQTISLSYSQYRALRKIVDTNFIKQ